MKITIDLSEEIVAELSRTSLTAEEVAKYIIERDHKKQLHLGVSNEQFSNKTKDGIIRRVYYYQKKAYGEKKTLAEFQTKWLKNKKFNKLFDKYEKKGFVKKEMPVFVRTQSGDLKVCHSSERDRTKFL